MAEQQLVDYIKKSSEAGQTADQTRNLLYKNGWTEAEVNDAFAALNQPSPQPQIVAQPKVETQPKIVIQPQVQQPKPQPQTQMQSPAENMSRMRTRPRLLSSLLMALIIIVVLGGVGYSVAGQYLNLPYSDIVWNLFAPNPQTVISKMMVNMKNVKAFRTAMQGEVNGTDKVNKVSGAKLTLNANSEFDNTNPAELKAVGNFTVNFFSVGSSSPLAAVTLNITTLGGTSYLQLDNIVNPGTYSYLGLDISKISGKWIKVDQNSIDAFSKAGLGSQGAAINITRTNSSALVKKIQDLVAIENLFSDAKKINSETISGQSTYHYLVKIGKDKLQDVITKIIDLQIQEASKLQGESSIVDLAPYLAKTFTDTIGDVNIELWIGKTDYLLYQIKLDKIIDSSKINPNSSQWYEVKFNATYSNFNKAITVQAPFQSEKIEDALAPLLKVARVHYDLGKIGEIAASLYAAESGYSSLCNRGLLNGYQSSYGQNLIELNNDIKDQKAARPSCFASAQKFCVSTLLDDGKYACISEMGFFGMTKCVSSKTLCE